jgi:general secretion pathway protein F
MTQFRYRAVLARTGEMKAGMIEGVSREAAFEALRRSGFMPLEAAAAEDSKRVNNHTVLRLSAEGRKIVTNAVSELSVLLGAGLPLDRALGIVIEHISQLNLKTTFQALREQVKVGVPLARAMQTTPGLFSPMASALAEAGEASGQLSASLGRLAETMNRSAALRETVSSAMVYPAMLIIIACCVILLMLLFVVPQFESMFTDLGGKLPAATRFILGASQLVRSYGLLGLAGFSVLLLGLRQWSRQPAVRRRQDRLLLRLPILGPLTASFETARFARTLASLVDNGVPLVTALGIARRVIGNSFMSNAVGRVAEEVREGGGITRPLAAAGVFPPLALSFLRTGEETARMAFMLDQLADTLERDVRNATQRLISIMTPLITIILGITVAGIIACIMSAILGINDLAIQ